jgi:hypothetical protein
VVPRRYRTFDRPFYSLDATARIAAGDVVYEDREQVKDTVVAVFDELERAPLQQNHAD